MSKCEDLLQFEHLRRRILFGLFAHIRRSSTSVMEVPIASKSPPCPVIGYQKIEGVGLEDGTDDGSCDGTEDGKLLGFDDGAVVGN